MVKPHHSQNRKFILLAAGILIVAVIGLFSLWRAFASDPQEGSKKITITVTGQDGDTQRYTVRTDAEYLLEAAQSVLTLEGETTAYGYTLYTINGVTADWADNVYWAVYVNGEYGQSSIDRQIVTDADAYEFVYETF